MGLAAVLAVAGGLSAWGAIALQASDWVARGADTLASTPANWNGNAIPTGSMRFSSGAYGATVTFDRFYTVGGHVWTGTDVAGKMYTPSTGAVNPFIWEATDPSCGINQTSSNLIVADNASQNAALEIRGGTYKTTGNFNVATAGSAWLNIKNATITVGGIAYFGSGGTAEVNFEEGSISTVGDLVMANASGTKARLTVGSGDPARVAKFIVPINKWAQMCGNAAGDGAMTLKAGGEFHCGYLCSRNPNAVLTLDGGALVKDGDVAANQKGYIYGGNAVGNADVIVEVTANGGAFDVGNYETTFDGTIRAASGVTEPEFTKRGACALHLGERASAFAGTFRAAEGLLTLATAGANTKAVLEEGDLTLAAGTLARLEVAGGVHMVAELPAHAGKVVVSGGTLKVTDEALVEGTPLRTAVNVNDQFEFTGTATAAEVFAPYIVGNFTVTQTIDDDGYVVLTATPYTLPAGYTALEYIATSGAQYIDLDYIHTGVTTIDCEVNIAKYQNTNFPGLFGALPSDGYKNAGAWVFFAFFGANTAVEGTRCAISRTGSEVANTGFPYGERVHFTCGVQTATWYPVENPEAVVSFSNTTCTTDGGKASLFFFCYNTGTAAAEKSIRTTDNGRCCRAKLYALRICEGSKIVRDFVPVRNADGEAGLYERLNGRFYGAGALSSGWIAGADEPGLNLTYVESTGEQYVDTDYLHTGATKVVCETSVNASQNNSWPGLFGTLPNDSYNNAGSWVFFPLFQASVGTSSSKCALSRTKYEQTGTGFFYDERVHLECEGYNASWYPVAAPENVRSIANANCVVDSGTSTLFIFTFNTGTSATAKSITTKEGGRRCQAKLYSFQISEYQDLLHDFVPYRQDGQVGLLDTLADESTAFHGSTGSNVPLKYGYAYAIDGNVLQIYDGTLTAGETFFAKSAVEKTGYHALAAGACLAYPALTLTSGLFDLADGAARTYTVAGLLAFRSGAKLALDLTAEGCDAFAPGTVDLSQASAANPVKVHIQVGEGVDFSRNQVVIPAGCVEGDAEKFVTDVPTLAFFVEDGALMLGYNDPTVPVRATWLGVGADPRNMADPANWDCRNGRGAAIEDAVPTSETTVVLPDGCTFVCTNGAPLVCKELVLPATLGGDSDFSGVVAPLIGRVDLAGHRLTMTRFVGDAEITGGETDYTRLAYIQSTGTQYLDTRYVHKSNTRLVFDLDVADAAEQVSYIPTLFGSMPGNSAKNAGNWSFFTHFPVSQQITSTSVLSRTGNEVKGTGFPYGERAILECTGNRADWYPVSNPDNVHSIVNASVATDAGVSSMTLFTLNVGASAGIVDPFMNDTTRFCAAKLYGFKIYEGETLVRDFVPVRRGFDGAVGLLEQVTGAFHGNLGRGEFVAGEVVEAAATTTTAMGELHVVAAAGETVENRTIAISGAVKVVKEGEGGFRPARANQTYVGGTDVTAGTLVSTGFGGNGQYGLGGAVTVRAGAVLDFDGWGDQASVPFVLDGGTIRNTTSRGHEGKSWLGTVTLTADSFLQGDGFGFVGSGSAYAVWGESRLTMNNHTLTIDVTVGKQFYSGYLTVTDAGTIVARSGGWFDLGGNASLSGKPVTAPQATFKVVGCALDVRAGSAVTFGSYVTGVQSYGKNTGAIQVATRFTPESQWNNTTVLDGAVVDLTAKTGAWNGRCHYSVSNVDGVLAFEEGATNTLDLAGRADLAPGLRVIDFTNFVVPESVTFVTDATTAASGYSLVRYADGFYLVDERLPVEALWTGALDGDLAKPGNWICHDQFGIVMPDTLPREMTVVTYSGNAVPAVALLDCASLHLDDVELTGDCDWRGINMPVTGSVRLNGHRLALSDLSRIELISDNREGYQVLESIQATGTQHLDTGYLHTPDTRLVFDVMINATQNNNYSGLFGSMPNNSYKNAGNWTFFPMFAARADASTVTCAFSRYGSEVKGPHFPCGVKVHATFAGRNATWYPVDDPAATASFANNTCNIDGGKSTLFVFNFNTGASADAKSIYTSDSGRYCQATLYAFQIYEGQTLVRDFVPARRVADGAVGLWERKQNTFHPNIGTGAFVAGPAIAAATCTFGELHLDVPAGKTVANTTTRIEGAVKVVKEGEGVFSSATASPFSGGLRVEAGTVKSVADGATVRTYGALDGDIFVSTNAVFDVNGTSVAGYNFALARGTIANTGAAVANTVTQLARVRLVDDAAFNFLANYGLVAANAAATSLDLGGHALTVTAGSASSFFLANATVTGQGLLQVSGAGTFNPCLAASTITEAKLVTDGWVRADADVTVGVYETALIGADMAGTGTIVVANRFTPTGDFANVRILNGATIDLSTRSTALPLTTFGTLAFADGAQVRLDVGEPRGRAWAIAWTAETAPANLATGLAFKPASGARYGLSIVPEEGVRILSGLILTIR